MVPFQGRSHLTTHIPGKPNPDGIKVWALAEDAFAYCWNWHIPGEGNGPLDTPTPIALGGTKSGNKGNKTQAVVAKLVGHLPINPGGYHIWVDNLFTSTRFLEYMRTLNYGVTGTTRKNAGILQELLDFKASDKNDKVPWGTLKYLPTASNKVCQIAWKDSALTLMMSTVVDGSECVQKLRRRPKQGQKKEMAKHQPFKGLPRALLDIPKCFDNYNNNMGAVDSFDQLTAINAGIRPVKRGAWQALEHWLLRVILVNTYVILQRSRKHTDLTLMRSQQEHRLRIIRGLIDLAKATKSDNPICKKRRISQANPEAIPSAIEHHHIKSDVRRGCVYCKGKRRGDQYFKRRALGPLDPNAVHSKRREGRSSWKCLECDEALCNPRYRDCFERYHQNQ
jgi:hypothetical protein